MPKVDLTDAIFSFSKLKTFEVCPYSWFDIYVNKVDRIQNAFSQYGTLIHSVLEKYAHSKAGEENPLDTWELYSLLEENYDNSVTEKFPYNKYCDLSVKYRESAYKFFEDIDDCELIQGIESGRYKVIGIEKKFEYDIEVDGQIFKYQGYIDLVLLDLTDDNIIIVDHKSKSIKTTAKGLPNEKDIRDAYLQMSTYALSIKKDYGKYPKEIWINAFKIQSIFKKEFSIELAYSALEWCKDMIRNIRDENIFPKVPDAFFCTQLCSCRLTCGKFINFSKDGDTYGDQPMSQFDRINQQKMYSNDDSSADEVVKPFSWDDDEEFDI